MSQAFSPRTDAEPTTQGRMRVNLGGTHSGVFAETPGEAQDRAPSTVSVIRPPLATRLTLLT